MYFRGKQKQKVDVCIECISHSTAFRQCVQLTSMVRKLVLSCHSIAFDLLFLLSRRTSNASSTSFFFLFPPRNLCLALHNFNTSASSYFSFDFVPFFFYLFYFYSILSFFVIKCILI